MKEMKGWSMKGWGDEGDEGMGDEGLGRGRAGLIGHLRPASPGGMLGPSGQIPRAVWK